MHLTSEGIIYLLYAFIESWQTSESKKVQKVINCLLWMILLCICVAGLVKECSSSCTSHRNRAFPRKGKGHLPQAATVNNQCGVQKFITKSRLTEPISLFYCEYKNQSCSY